MFCIMFPPLGLVCPPKTAFLPEPLSAGWAAVVIAAGPGRLFSLKWAAFGPLFVISSIFKQTLDVRDKMVKAAPCKGRGPPVGSIPNRAGRRARHVGRSLCGVAQKDCLFIVAWRLEMCQGRRKNFGAQGIKRQDQSGCCVSHARLNFAGLFKGRVYNSSQMKKKRPEKRKAKKMQEKKPKKEEKERDS